MKIIGLCGPIGAGKTAAAEILGAHFVMRRISFADPLKGMLRSLGVQERNLTGGQSEKTKPLDILCGKSARQALQLLGTEWGRDMIGHDLWTRSWSMRTRRANCAVIADDIRFQNEVDAVQALGGTVICIVRSMEQLKQTAGHVSEDFQRLVVPRLVVNDGTLADFRANLLSVAEDEKTRPSRMMAG